MGTIDLVRGEGRPRYEDVKGDAQNGNASPPENNTELSPGSRNSIENYPNPKVEAQTIKHQHQPIDEQVVRSHIYVQL